LNLSGNFAGLEVVGLVEPIVRQDKVGDDEDQGDRQPTRAGDGENTDRVARNGAPRGGKTSGGQQQANLEHQQQDGERLAAVFFERLVQQSGGAFRGAAIDEDDDQMSDQADGEGGADDCDAGD
jgi:hypothetical protein